MHLTQFTRRFGLTQYSSCLIKHLVSEQFKQSHGLVMKTVFLTKKLDDQQFSLCREQTKSKKTKSPSIFVEVVLD
jgi:hypothetical protein